MGLLDEFFSNQNEEVIIMKKSINVSVVVLVICFVFSLFLMSPDAAQAKAKKIKFIYIRVGSMRKKSFFPTLHKIKKIT